MSVKICPSCNANNPPFEEFCISCGASLSEVSVSAGAVSINEGLMESSEAAGIFDLGFNGWLTPKIVKFLYFLQVVVFPIVGLLSAIIFYSNLVTVHENMCEIMFKEGGGFSMYTSKDSCMAAAPGIDQLLIYLAIGAFVWLITTIFVRLSCEASLLFFRMESHLKHLRNKR